MFHATFKNGFKMTSRIEEMFEWVRLVFKETYFEITENELVMKTKFFRKQKRSPRKLLVFLRRLWTNLPSCWTREKKRRNPK